MDNRDFLQEAFSPSITLAGYRFAQSGGIAGNCSSFAMAYQFQASMGRWMCQVYWSKCLCLERMSSCLACQTSSSADRWQELACLEWTASWLNPVTRLWSFLKALYWVGQSFDLLLSVFRMMDSHLTHDHYHLNWVPLWSKHLCYLLLNLQSSYQFHLMLYCGHLLNAR